MAQVSAAPKAQNMNGGFDVSPKNMTSDEDLV